MKQLFIVLIVGLLSLSQATKSNSAGKIDHRNSLNGSIWVSADSHDRSPIGPPGKIPHEKGTEIHVYFLVPLEDGYLIKVSWLNKNTKSDVRRSAILVSAGGDDFIYKELHPRPISDLSDNKKGHGIFRIIDNDTAELTDVRRRADGSTHTFVFRFHRVDFQDRS